MSERMGNTQGMALRIRPPRKANPSASNKVIVGPVEGELVDLEG